MSGKKKHIKVKSSIDETAIIQSIKSGEEDIKELYFTELNLRIQSKTLSALHELKHITGVSPDRAISFLLDAGAVMFSAIKQEMLEKLMKEKKR